MLVAVFQRNFLFAYSVDFRKKKVEYFFRIISILDCYVSVWKDTIEVLLGLKMRSLIRGELGWVWNSNFGRMISYITLCRVF
jgi:hypothetical protein